MDEQLIAFIDLLGFSSIIKAPDDARQRQILSLLTSLKETEGDFRSEATPIDATSSEHSVRPAVSAFSDHIVYSIPVGGLASVGIGPIVIGLANFVASIFSGALHLGCLVRGGIAYGPLHHGAGVVFGPGLVEAYELESRFAGRPRIVVSEGAMERLVRNPYLYRDDDGFSCLNYVRAAYDLEVQFKTDWVESARGWIATVRTLCEDQIGVLNRTQNRAGLQNWRWFLNRFDDFAEALHPSVTGRGADA